MARAIFWTFRCRAASKSQSSDGSRPCNRVEQNPSPCGCPRRAFRFPSIPSLPFLIVATDRSANGTSGRDLFHGPVEVQDEPPSHVELVASRSSGACPLSSAAAACSTASSRVPSKTSRESVRALPCRDRPGGGGSRPRRTSACRSTRPSSVRGSWGFSGLSPITASRTSKCRSSSNQFTFEAARLEHSDHPADVIRCVTPHALRGARSCVRVPRSEPRGRR